MRSAALIAWIVTPFAVPAPRADTPGGVIATHNVSSRIVTAQATSPSPSDQRPTVCTEQYAPVCGRVGGISKTYSNQCFARAAGAQVTAQGPCAGPAKPPTPK
ncbi:MAG: hypothetical protein HY056_03715 [Proteobacteria bacterium]|nr:hypothetical protein [Pseudomonadota bacterium]